MVSSWLVHAIVHLQAHMSLEHYGHPRLLLSRSTDMVTAIVYVVVVTMDLIWQSLKRLFITLCIISFAINY